MQFLKWIRLDILHEMKDFLLSQGVEELDGELVASPRVVRTGDSRRGRIAILEGLNSGDRVATVGQNKLFKGARVAIDDSVHLQ